MSSIGIVVRADQGIETLGREWVPAPLGSRREVESAVTELILCAEHLRLTADIEDSEDSHDPRAISFSGIWGDQERVALKTLCERLKACFYDAEMGDFIEL